MLQLSHYTECLYAECGSGLKNWHILLEVDKPGWRFDETPLEKLVLGEMATWLNDIAPIFNILLQKKKKMVA